VTSPQFWYILGAYLLEKHSFTRVTSISWKSTPRCEKMPRFQSMFTIFHLHLITQ
ncbi:unnamed protein product, partial [Nesidiocoris tenuis]